MQEMRRICRNEAIEIGTVLSTPPFYAQPTFFICIILKSNYGRVHGDTIIPETADFFNFVIKA